LSQDKTATDQQYDVKQLPHYGSLKTNAPDMHSRINSAEFAAIQDMLGVHSHWMLIAKTLAQIDFASNIVHQLDHFKDKTQQERVSGCTLLICAYPKL